jgi:hypothetical protein
MGRYRYQLIWSRLLPQDFRFGKENVILVTFSDSRFPKTSCFSRAREIYCFFRKAGSRFGQVARKGVVLVSLGFLSTSSKKITT